MDIVASVLIGSIAALLAIVALRGSHLKPSATLAVGILGALLGLAIDVAMGYDRVLDFIAGEHLASACGAASALFLWIVAQRLFLGPPTQVVRD